MVVRLRWLGRWTVRLTLLLAVVAAIRMGSSIPDVRWLRTTNPEQTNLMRYRAEQQRVAGSPAPVRENWVALSEISPNLIRAVVVAEDYNFFDHHGFDWESLWNALLLDLRHGRVIKGGSGITQQLAKNLFLEPARSLFRKTREALITYRLERELGKIRILELYLNLIELGPGLYGAEAAALAYYHKPASDLDLSEAIALASILPNPTLAALIQPGPALVQRQREIADALHKKRWISAAQHDQALQDLGRRLRRPPEHSPTVAASIEPQEKYRRPDYWISQLVEPDRELMTQSDIREFNERALIVGGGIDHLNLPVSVPRKDVLNKIFEVAGLSPVWSALNCHVEPSLIRYLGNHLLVPPSDGGTVETRARYDRNNRELTRYYYCRLLRKLNLRGIGEPVTIRYALVARRSDVLAWPVDDLIMGKPDDHEFNVLQQSSVQVGAPVAALHTSEDGHWVFIRSAYFDGWIRERDLAWTTRRMAAHFPGPDFLVVTAASLATGIGVDLSMGMQIPLVRHADHGFVARIPARGEKGKLEFADAVLPDDGVTEGFVPYTRSRVIVQAFKLLGQSYGWGGSRSGLDCSGFMQDVFNVFGIRLPRNSAAQTEVGREVDDSRMVADRESATVERWEPAVTLLGLPGHVMLYLGRADGRPHMIHALWGVKDKAENLVKIDRVAVTDLDLGAGSRKGSLFERISAASVVDLRRTDLTAVIRSFTVWLLSRRTLVWSLALVTVTCLSLVALGFALRRAATASR